MQSQEARVSGGLLQGRKLIKATKYEDSHVTFAVHRGDSGAGQAVEVRLTPLERVIVSLTVCS